jgi:hypothetical protein
MNHGQPWEEFAIQKGKTHPCPERTVRPDDSRRGLDEPARLNKVYMDTALYTPA